MGIGNLGFTTSHITILLRFIDQEGLEAISGLLGQLRNEWKIKPLCTSISAVFRSIIKLK
jgi:hypothetical protein